MSDEKSDDKKDLTGILEQTSLPAIEEPPGELPQELQEVMSEDLPAMNSDANFPVDFSADSPTGDAPVDVSPAEPAEEMKEFESLEDFAKYPTDELPLSEGHPDKGHLTSDLPPVELPPDEEDELQTPLEKIKTFSEQTPIGHPAVPASVPFSVLVTGALRPEERDKLRSLVLREHMGVDESELALQFETDRILIPRISEFAAILIVQTLRDTHAKIQMGPSDEIFSTVETRSDDMEIHHEPQQQSEVFDSSGAPHPAENLPITTADSMPGQALYVIVDTVSANAALKTQAVEAKSTNDYQELVDALQREIKYKAYRKGANAIIGFKVQLNQLTSPSSYRVLVIGTAVKTRT